MAKVEGDGGVPDLGLHTLHVWIVVDVVVVAAAAGGDSGLFLG